jgi:hypothetical protein
VIEQAISSGCGDALAAPRLTATWMGHLQVETARRLRLFMDGSELVRDPLERRDRRLERVTVCDGGHS